MKIYKKENNIVSNENSCKTIIPEKKPKHYLIIQVRVYLLINILPNNWFNKLL